MQPSLLASLVIIAQLLFFSVVVFRVLRRCGRAADEAAALALCLLPLVQGGAVLIAIALGWRLTAVPLLAGLMLGAAALLDPREFLRQQVVWAWALVALCWLGQEALVYCHGGAFWAWDWQEHWKIAVRVNERMRGGLWPIVPGRTALLGVWAAPALSVISVYAVFQITTVLANTLAVPAAWLWARRWGGPRGAVAAVGMILLCTGLTQSAVYSWPKACAAALVLTAMYLWISDWQILAGLTFAAAFQAHQSAVAYTIPFFLGVSYFGMRQYPWRMPTVYGIAMGLWAFVLHQSFPEKWSATPYFIWPNVSLAGQLSATLSYFAGSIFFVGWLDGLRGPHGFDSFLRAGTDAWLATVPLIGTVALARAARRLRHADAGTVCVGLALAAGGTLTWLVLQDARNMVIQSTLAPLLLGLLAASGAASVSLPASAAVPLWAISSVQYLIFRVPLLWENVWYPDALNLNLKQTLRLRFLSDLGGPVLAAIAIAVASVAGAVAFVAVLWTARGLGTVQYGAAVASGPAGSGARSPRPGARAARTPVRATHRSRRRPRRP